MTQPMIELLPCPFCGGTAEMRENGIGDYYVMCLGCNVASSDYRCEEPTHAAGRWNTRAALTAQAGDGNRLPLDEFERGRQYGLKESLNCVCDIHKRFAKNQAAWDAISQAQKAINMKRVQVKRAAIASAKDGAK